MQWQYAGVVRREIFALFTDQALITAKFIYDNIVDICFACRLHDLCWGSAWFADGNILGDRALKEYRVLEYRTDVLAQVESGYIRLSTPSMRTDPCVTS